MVRGATLLTSARSQLFSAAVCSSGSPGGSPCGRPGDSPGGGGEFGEECICNHFSNSLHSIKKSAGSRSLSRALVAGCCTLINVHNKCCAIDICDHSRLWAAAHSSMFINKCCAIDICDHSPERLWAAAHSSLFIIMIPFLAVITRNYCPRFILLTFAITLWSVVSLHSIKKSAGSRSLSRALVVGCCTLVNAIIRVANECNRMVNGCT